MVTSTCAAARLLKSPRKLTCAAAGVVLRAFYEGTEVAVKRPKMKLTLNARDLKRLTQEVHAMHKASHMSLPLKHAALQSRLRVLTRRRVQVNHPNCVKIFSASLKACDPFIVMEWMEGGSWFDALGLDPPAYHRVKAARETSGALAYLHHALISIIHGDIKSLNMLLTRGGSSKVRRCHAPSSAVR